MNDDDAKKILALYRPGSADRTDPAFKEALERTKPFPPKDRWQFQPASDLANWFHDHCASYLGLQGKFQKIPAPPGLKERILAGYKPPTSRIIPIRFPAALAMAAVFALCLGLAALWWHSHGRGDDFAVYRSRMARTALEPYSMEMQNGDLRSIGAYLTGRKAPADYMLPAGVSKAQPVGCAVLHWQGQPVSMLCFRSGQPLAPGAQSDLWLFVVDQASVEKSPAGPGPVVAPIKNLTTASWSEGGKTYILATVGNEASLRKFL